MKIRRCGSIFFFFELRRCGSIETPGALDFLLCFLLCFFLLCFLWQAGFHSYSETEGNWSFTLWLVDTESDNNNRWPFSAHPAAELIKLARCCISGCSRRLAAVCCRGALSATFGSRHAGIVCVQRAPGSDSPLCEEKDHQCRWRVSVGVEQGKAFRVQAPPVSVPFCGTPDDESARRPHMPSLIFLFSPLSRNHHHLCLSFAW
jgi:hypothetical protein